MFPGAEPVGQFAEQIIVPVQFPDIDGTSSLVNVPVSAMPTVEEFQRLHAELKQPFNNIVMLCVCFGLRISECLALKWSDVDWDQSTLQVERGIVEQNVDDVKTDDSRRTFILAPELLSVLKEWSKVTPFGATSDWMFASPLKIGRLPYSYTGVWRELKRAAAVSKIGEIATHAFRHTYRTWLDSIGTPVGVQQRLMRHADIRTTMNQYGNALASDMQKAQGKVIQLVFKSA